MRKIPVTMATQHPDNASPSPFTNKCFISTQDEIDECYRCFAEFGVGEYMWDWEGKLVDEAVIDRLYQQYTDFFRNKSLGKDVFLTFRVPNIWEEASHRLPRAFMNILSAENAAQSYDFHSPPIFEIILPMTTKASQLIYLQEKFTKISEATKDIFEINSNLEHIRVIPLVETMDAMFGVYDLLKEYHSYITKKNNAELDHLRLFIARSDPAMNNGLIPAVIGAKVAISEGHRFMKDYGVEVYPWIGAGCLPFRGGVNPNQVDKAIEEYKGTYSYTVQSAFRCDYDLYKVKSAIDKLNNKVPLSWQSPHVFEQNEIELLKNFINEISIYFQSTVESMADLINFVADKLPNHRERVQHVGLFGYSRGVGKVKLPRAIKFSGAFYSLGIPPEFIGTGRMIREAKKKGTLDLINKSYIYLKEDLIQAGRYLNKENLTILAKEHKGIKDIKEDIEILEKHYGIEFGPKDPKHMLHKNLTSNIYYHTLLNDDFSYDILKAAELRRSLG